MPLPDNANEAWPPAWMDPIMRRIEIWAAWHSGDPDQLAAVYSGDATADSTGFFASEQGGFRATVKRVVSRVVRWFWGQRTTQPRRRLHDPLAGDIASASADLLFSDPPKITVVKPGTDDPVEKAQEFVDSIMDDGAQASLLEGGEIASALSGVYLRARWDSEAERTHWFDVVAPDCAVPEWSLGQLSAVTFWKVLSSKNSKVFRHLERHEPGSIIHAVYEGTLDAIGDRLLDEQGRPALAMFDATAPLADVVDANGVIATGITRLTAQYVPNMRPNKIWRNIPQATCLGVSDFSGIEGLLDANDLAYSSLMRDVDLGKARLLVPRQYLTDHGRGEGASLDLDREIYEPVNAMTGEEGLDIEMVQFDIRVEDHEQVLKMLKSDAVTRAGYSPQTFGLNGEVAMTATEVAAKERRSLTTRARKTKYWGPGLKGIVETLLELAGFADVEVKLEWPDGVAVDPEAVSRKVANWESARAASVKTKVEELHPDWAPEDVDKEVGRILEEQSIGQAEDPGTFTGGTFGNEATMADTATVDEELEAAA